MFFTTLSINFITSYLFEINEDKQIKFKINKAR